MKTPTIEEVKEYFKYAKKVKSNDYIGQRIVDISKHEQYDFRFGDCIWFDKAGSESCCVWDSVKGYAEISSYKTKTYQVDEEFILKLSNKYPEIKHDLKDTFPDVFKSANGWYKCEQSYGNWYGFYENNLLKYTITNDGFNTITAICEYQNESKATESEIKKALINEAKERYDFNQTFEWTFEDVKYRISYPEHSNFSFENNTLLFGSGVLFEDGIWATQITQTEVTQSDLIDFYAKSKGIDKDNLKIVE